MDLEELGLSGRTSGALRRVGVDEVDQLVQLNRRQLLALAGIGEAAVAEVVAALLSRGMDLSEDVYAPYVCAREGKVVGDAQLTDLWLCDPCAEHFTTGPFDGTPAEFVSEPMGGHCVNCGEDRSSVRLRQWLLCGVCARVAQSFGKSVVAAKRLMDRWASEIRPQLNIELVDIDFPVLNRRSPEVIKAKVAAIDFEGVDANNATLFGFEMKTGPGGIGRGAVKPMSEFQLDCSDCDDILSVAREKSYPVYLVHAQVVTRASPPTPMFIPVEFWWADLYTMRDAFKNVRERSRETRTAAYYETGMFRPLIDFVNHVQSGGLDQVRDRVQREGLPQLYW